MDIKGIIMNRTVKKLPQRLIDGCLKTIKDLGCCKVKFNPAKAMEHHDGRLRLIGPGGQHIDYIVEAKQALTGSRAGILLYKIKALQSQGLPVLLFTDYIHEKLAEDLRKNKVEFVDVAGNVFIDRSSIYVYVIGRRRTLAPERPTRAFQPTGLSLIFLLLKQPAAIAWDYRKISSTAGTSLGAVGWVLRDLRALGFIRLTGKGQRRLVNWRDLLERWEEGFVERLRPKLFRKTYRIAGEKSLDQLADAIKNSIDRDKILVGGEMGAALLTRDFRPARVTLHLLREPLEIITRLQLIPDSQGPVAVLDTFGEFTKWEEEQPNGLTLVDPLLIHSELLISHSDRLKKAADDIYKNYILSRLEKHDQNRR